MALIILYHSYDANITTRLNGNNVKSIKSGFYSINRFSYYRPLSGYDYPLTAFARC
jgi:hypothetical protein